MTTKKKPPTPKDDAPAKPRSARDAARAARGVMRRSSVADTEDTAFLKQKVDTLEHEVFGLRSEIAELHSALLESLEAFSAKATEVSENMVRIERMISQKTIESLTRAQVARIMREEGSAKE